MDLMVLDTGYPVIYYITVEAEEFSFQGVLGVGICLTIKSLIL